ncbi:MAG TPA: PD-(D/E)XK nuclease domain-containing protein [Clostridiales bacterium]|nr:PD-(D/E)XK nuclease domain-containing protein [Clostridiales bacterium]
MDIDIFLAKNKAFEQSIRYEWIIELKYLKEQDRNKFNKVLQDAENQLKCYANSSRIKEMKNIGKIKRAAVIMVGKDNIFMKLI